MADPTNRYPAGVPPSVSTISLDPFGGSANIVSDASVAARWTLPPVAAPVNGAASFNVANSFSTSGMAADPFGETSAHENTPQQRSVVTDEALSRQIAQSTAVMYRAQAAIADDASNAPSNGFGLSKSRSRLSDSTISSVSGHLPARTSLSDENIRLDKQPRRISQGGNQPGRTGGYPYSPDAENSGPISNHGASSPNVAAAMRTPQSASSRSGHPTLSSFRYEN